MKFKQLVPPFLVGAAFVAISFSAFADLKDKKAPVPPATGEPAYHWDYEFGTPIEPNEVTYEDYRKQHAEEAARLMHLPAAAVADGMDTWHWWVGVDNPGFWRDLAKLTGGKHNYTNLRIDFLRMILTVPRGERWTKLGLINDPDTVPADKPDQFGLKMDRMKDGTLRWDPEKFGYSSGVIGLQLFKNEKFDPKHWSLDKYLHDASSVEPPYKIGMACVFCHIGFNPLNPPKDPANPKWPELTSSIGNQFLREGLIFGLDIEDNSIVQQYLATQEPGTSETSRFPTDSIDNPTNINSIFRLQDRLKEAHVEKITPAQAEAMKTMYKAAGVPFDTIGGALGGTDAEPTIKVPHVLTDGADSMGLVMASTRVYVNEGMMHDQWYDSWPIDIFNLKHTIKRDFKPAEFDIIGKWTKDPNDPWMQTVMRMPNMATFLMSYDSFPLKDAPGGRDYLKANDKTLHEGKIAFAENCAQCHSSKKPDMLPPDLAGQQKAWVNLVMKKDFLDHNYLSDDERYAVNELGTNTQRAEGTNAMAGWTWGQMSSQTYKDMKKEQIELVDKDAKGNPRPLYNPLTKQYDIHWKGTNAFYRTPTLVSIWATAPFFHNNALGKYTGDPSVKGRMDAYDDAAEKLLWPEKRPNFIKVTTAETSLPEIFPGLTLGMHFFQDMSMKILSFPAGTPVNLVMSVNPSHVLPVVGAYFKGFFTGPSDPNISSFIDRRRAAGMKAIQEKLLAINTVPDFIEDRGHTYGASLSDEQKHALIEYMKTF